MTLNRALPMCQIRCTNSGNNQGMKLLNAIMITLGWAFFIFVILCALGLGSLHLHVGPLDFRLPFHWR